MTLSIDCTLYYVLRHSGFAGHLSSGRVEKEVECLRVYDAYGKLNEYISGHRLRSWCLVRAGHRVPEWTSIMPEDAGRLPGE